MAQRAQPGQHANPRAVGLRPRAPCPPIGPGSHSPFPRRRILFSAAAVGGKPPVVKGETFGEAVGTWETLLRSSPIPRQTQAQTAWAPCRPRQLPPASLDWPHFLTNHPSRVASIGTACQTQHHMCVTSAGRHTVNPFDLQDGYRRRAQGSRNLATQSSACLPEEPLCDKGDWTG